MSSPANLVNWYVSNGKIAGLVFSQKYINPLLALTQAQSYERERELLISHDRSLWQF